MRNLVCFCLIVVLVCLFTGTEWVKAQEIVTISLENIDDMALNADGSYLLAWATDGTITSVNLQNTEEIISMQHGAALLGALWNKSGNRILSWSAELVQIWNAGNGNALLSLKIENGRGAGWVNDTQVYTWSPNGIIIWDAQSGDEINNIEGSAIEGVSLNTDGGVLLWWNGGGTANRVTLNPDLAVTVSANEAQPTGAMTAADLIPGKWEVTWGEKVSSCEELGTTSANRPFIMATDVANDTFSTEDVFIWSRYNFVYRINADGQYTFLRNQSYNDGTVLSFEYITKIVSPTRIEGVSSAYFTGVNCTDSESFVLTLVDEDITCMVGSEQGANLRSGPGTNFNRLETLNGGVPADVIGQSIGTDNLRWWKLSDGGWVREDVVTEVGTCDTLPEAQP